MTYSKPKNVRYVDMCIWIDENAYKDDKDVDKFFQYLYHIFYMLAYKSRYFYQSYEYDDFSIFAAIQLYKRYENSTEENKIKSVLNYAKSVIYPYKIQFQQQEYKENHYVKSDDSEEFYDVEDQFKLRIVDQASKLNKVHFKVYLDNISRTIKECVNHTPYKKNTPEYLSLYTSCLLTFLNSITPTSKNVEKMNNITRSDGIRENLYNKIYSELTNEKVLFHLNPNMGDFVKVLISEVKAVVRNELNYIINERVDEENIISDIYSEMCKEEGTDETN